MIPLPDPPLCGEEVRLRPWSPDDAGALAAGWSDPDAVRWTAVPSDRSTAAARRWISGDATRRRNGSSLDLAIEVLGRGADGTVPSLTGGEVVGEVGLAGFRPGSSVAMVGYWSLPRYRGRGMTSTAVDLVARWALANLGLDALVALCHPDNPASVAVAARCGFATARVAEDGRLIMVRRRAAR